MPGRRPYARHSGAKRPALWGPRQVDASRPLLFERLTGLMTGGDEPLRDGALYGKDELMASIERELDALFNTRAPVSVDILDERTRSTIDYGIPDLSLYSAADSEARIALAAQLLRAIEAYEPRLSAPRVKVVPHPQRERQLLAQIDGSIQLGSLVELVSFRISLGRDHSDAG
jgi:type VI secretion system lysozyme-like protein